MAARVYINDASVVRFLNSAQKPHPSRAEQKKMAQQIEAGRYARAMMTRSIIANPDTLFKLNEIAETGERTRHYFAECFLALVVSVCTKYVHIESDLEFEDMIQEGNDGLMIAVDQYDWRKGYMFSTFARNWILAQVLKALAEKSGRVRLSKGLYADISRVHKTHALLYEKLSREPSDEELAKASGVDRKKLKLFAQATSMRDVRVSIDQPIMNKSGSITPLHDFIVDTSLISPELYIEEAVWREKLREAFEKLDPLQYQVVCMHFGIGVDRQMSVGEIGDRIGFTKSKVTTVLKNGLTQLRVQLKTQGIDVSVLN